METFQWVFLKQITRTFGNVFKDFLISSIKNLKKLALFKLENAQSTYLNTASFSGLVNCWLILSKIPFLTFPQKVAQSAMEIF